MATGFGCMVVGPAGSGKVSFLLFLTKFPLVNDVSRPSAGSWTTRKDSKSLQSRSSCRCVQIYVRYRRPRPNFTWWRTRNRKLRSEWGPCLLYGALGGEHWMAAWRVARIRRWFVHTVWLPRLNRTLLTFGCNDTIKLGDYEKWVQSLCGLLFRWHLPQWANKVHLYMPHISIYHDADELATP